MSRDNPTLTLGSVRRLGRDLDGHEMRERLEAEVECSECGKVVRLWSETVQWVPGKVDKATRIMAWDHGQYGPATGECCGMLVVSDFEGVQSYIVEGDSDA